MGGMEADFWMNIAFSLLAGFLAGMAGAMGLGGGSVLLIYLTVFAGVEQLNAQGINLIFFLPTAFVAIFIYSKRRVIKWKTILPIIIFGVFGTLLSGTIVGTIKTDLLKTIFGILMVFYGGYELLAKQKKKKVIKTIKVR